MSLPDVVAAVLLVAMTVYAILGGTDFGAGFWYAMAGDSRAGSGPRMLINRALGPVWAINHIWLIFGLVLLWSAFGPAFAPIMTTLSIPVTIAALGIVLRGSTFAFPNEAQRLSRQRFFGAAFEMSSVLTPFLLGTALGGIASGRVPVGNAAGDLVTSWLNPTSLVVGVLVVTVAAYLAAVFLVTDAHRLANAELEDYFRNRAIGAALCASLVGAVGFFVMRADSPFVFQGLVEVGWPLLLLSAACGLGALVLLRQNARVTTWLLAASAVAAILWSWGLAQYPYLLPTSLTIADAAAAPGTLEWLLIVFVAAAVLVVSAFVFVFRLDQKRQLECPPLELHTSDNEGAPRVVIVGGGFGGVAAAKGLKHTPVQVTLIDRTNYHLFQPLLYQVAAGMLEPGTIATPIRSMFRAQHNVDVRMAEVVAIDKKRRCVVLDGDAPPVPYDYLVLATGVQGSYFGHDDWAPLAPSMKTLVDAESLRRRITGALEAADREPDPRLREQWLTFVLVGAGPTGCELAGELAESFLRGLPAEYRHIDPRQARIILVEAGPRALATFSEDLARGALNKLHSLGVEVRVGQAVDQVDADGVLIDGERISSRTVLWTAGVAASPAGRWLGVETDRDGRVVVDPQLTVPKHPEIFVVGDTAHIEQHGKVLPGVAQVALQGGVHAAQTISARVLDQPPPPPFAYFDKGSMATIAVSYAVVERGRFKISGPLGKLGWALIHMLYLGRAEGQFLLCLQWMFGVLLGRPGSRYIDTPAQQPAVVPRSK